MHACWILAQHPRSSVLPPRSTSHILRSGSHILRSGSQILRSGSQILRSGSQILRSGSRIPLGSDSQIPLLTGVPVISYFPLANGLLSGRYDADHLPAFPKSLTMKKYVVGGVEGYPEGGYTPLLLELRRIASARGKSVPQVAINWVLCKGAVPIPGARDGTMAAANMGAMDWRLGVDEVEALECAADAVGFEFSSGGFKLE